MTKKRHLKTWLLLAVYVPMLLLSSLHVHEGGISHNEVECSDCVHHSCHGHLTQTATWVHDCVLCEFLTLTMLTAAVMAVTIYVHVCKKNRAQLSIGHLAACWDHIVARGPPSV